MFVSKSVRQALCLGVVTMAAVTWTATASAGAKGRPGAYTSGAAAPSVHRGRHKGQRAHQRRGHRHMAPRVARRHHGRRVVQAVPPARTGPWLGPVSPYFEQGTGGSLPADVQVHGRRAMPPLAQQRMRDSRRRPAGRAGEIGSGISAAQVRRLQSQLPARQSRHVVNRASQWAARDSAGVRFGPTAAQVPLALSTSDQAGAVLHGRINDRQRNAGGLPPGELVRTIGNTHTRIIYRSRRYLVSDAIWYQPWNGRFRVVVPPVGLTLNSLPAGFDTLRRDGVNYYAANGVYLRAMGRGGYIVVRVPL